MTALLATDLEYGRLDPLSRDCPEDLPCRVEDSELWFAERPADLERAKALCQRCPARLVCLTAAVERREPCGVWGGEIFIDGVIVPFKRGRGRPRKATRSVATRHRR